MKISPSRPSKLHNARVFHPKNKSSHFVHHPIARPLIPKMTSGLLATIKNSSDNTQNIFRSSSFLETDMALGKNISTDSNMTISSWPAMIPSNSNHTLPFEQNVRKPSFHPLNYVFIGISLLLAVFAGISVCFFMNKRIKRKPKHEPTWKQPGHNGHTKMAQTYGSPLSFQCKISPKEEFSNDFPTTLYRQSVQERFRLTPDLKFYASQESIAWQPTNESNESKNFDHHRVSDQKHYLNAAFQNLDFEPVLLSGIQEQKTAQDRKEEHSQAYYEVKDPKGMERCSPYFPSPPNYRFGTPDLKNFHDGNLQSGMATYPSTKFPSKSTQTSLSETLCSNSYRKGEKHHNEFISFDPESASKESVKYCDSVTFNQRYPNFVDEESAFFFSQIKELSSLPYAPPTNIPSLPTPALISSALKSTLPSKKEQLKPFIHNQAFTGTRRMSPAEASDELQNVLNNFEKNTVGKNQVSHSKSAGSSIFIPLHCRQAQNLKYQKASDAVKEPRNTLGEPTVTSATRPQELGTKVAPKKNLKTSSKGDIPSKSSTSLHTPQLTHMDKILENTSHLAEESVTKLKRLDNNPDKSRNTIMVAQNVSVPKYKVSSTHDVYEGIVHPMGDVKKSKLRA
ncbi:hypothetical protein O181_014221 [Austropuccinia psidii MF-1]|uniref:Uncharacterized protein n=1 Tax=Austropuccinia psidii MF-1 TaxID=1389203 RepID=A0A9Q3GNY8_9BASI|nr:hypothetical protein [Austropuccinia psidii MF-1]